MPSVDLVFEVIFIDEFRFHNRNRYSITVFSTSIRAKERHIGESFLIISLKKNVIGN